MSTQRYSPLGCQPLQPLVLPEELPGSALHQAAQLKATRHAAPAEHGVAGDSAAAAGHAGPAEHAGPAVLAMNAAAKDALPNRHAVDICCNVLYCDPIPASSPDDQGLSHTPMSRLGAVAAEQPMENGEPISCRPAVSAFEQRLMHCSSKMSQQQSSSQPGQQSGNLLGQHGHMAAELVSQRHSQPAPDVCLIGSPPRQQQLPYKHVGHEQEATAAPAPHAELAAGTAQQPGDDSAAAELDFMQILEAAQHQRVESVATTVCTHHLELAV